MRHVSAVLVLVVALLSPPALFAQSSPPSVAHAGSSLISLSGVFRPADGQPPARAEEATLAIYADESGGTPLWQETQRVAIDASGGYTLLLGATAPQGVPLNLFTSGEARWLGVLFERSGEVEGPRTRITSVPYALRASDADTLGGQPASAYILAPTPLDGSHATPASGNKGMSVETSEAVLPGTQSLLAKYVTGDDVGAAGMFEFGGRVGIGTTSPFDSLHVRFNNSNGGATGVAVQNLSNGPTAYSGMLFYDHNGFLGQFQGFNNNTHEYRINNVARNAATSRFDGSINFMIGGASRLFIAPPEDILGADRHAIGIGTTSPDALLEVSQAFSANFYATVYNIGTGPTFQGRSAGGSPAAPGSAGPTLANFSGGGYATTRFAESTAAITMFSGEPFTNTGQGAGIDFDTTSNGVAFRERRMELNQSGFVYIGNFLSPTDRLHVDGDIRVGTSGTNGCVKSFSGAMIAGTCASDRRFKTDVTPFAPALAAVTALEPVHYVWRAAEFPQRRFGNRRNDGLIAQDVARAVPEIVVTDADGYQAVDYTKLPLLTVQTVKDLRAENDALKSRLADLERQMRELLTMTPARR